MKLLLMFTFILTVTNFSNTAEAGYVDRLKAKSWSELQSDWDLDFENDKVWFGGKRISIFKTCMVSSTKIRTFNKVRIEEYDGEDHYTTGYGYLYKSIYSSRTVVDGDGTIDENYIIPVTRMIKVYQEDDDFDGDYLFSKKYSIPNCR